VEQKVKKSISIKDFVTTINYCVGEGEKHNWECFGPSARFLDWSDPDLSSSASMVYDSSSYFVYEVTVWDNLKDKVYRWITPKNLKKYKNESKKRCVSFTYAYDRVKYEDVTPTRILGILKRLVAAVGSVKKQKKKKRDLWICQ